MKRNYLLSVIVMGLIVLSLYSTYAMFTSSVETDNAISMDTVINYTFKINGTQEVVISSKSKLRFNAIVQNDMTGKISYGLYYKMISPTTLPSRVTIAEITDASSVTKGQLNQNSEITVPIIIENDSGSEIKVEIGVVTGYATETQGVTQLIYDNGKIPITDIVSSSNISGNSCSSIIECSDECEPRYINNEWVNYCMCNTWEKIKNLDTSGANVPDLLDGLIPIKYNGSIWVKADETNADDTYQWYNYNNQMWANAALVTGSSREKYERASMGTTINESDVLAYYVWIPRYKYKLFNATKTVGVDSYNARTTGIDIVFESGTGSTGTVSCTIAIDGTESCTGASNGAYYTHPAFTFGSTELTGIWVGKFELTGSTTSPTIKPNEKIIKSFEIAELNTTIKKISEAENAFGINSNEADSHMMKNIEWGVVAYLTNSKYGMCPNSSCTEIGINNNSNYITGCGAPSGSDQSSNCNNYMTTTGMLASTTGNVYGIYDMSGGEYEYVMGNMVSNDGSTMMSGDSSVSNSGYNGILYNKGNNSIYNEGIVYPESKYYDRYPYSAYSTLGNRGHLGDATSEVNLNRGWYDDSMYFVNLGNSWTVRGGNYLSDSSAGIFAITNTAYSALLSYHSSRAVLVRY